MATYVFHCDACQLTFDELCSWSDRSKVVCKNCQGLVVGVVTAPKAIIFTNPRGTSKEDNFEYVAKYNHERAKGERRAAEQANKHGQVYNPIDDMPQYEGKIS